MVQLAIFNVFFCFNIILTFATWFLWCFSTALRLNICKAQVFFRVFQHKYLHFHIRKLFHHRVKSALIAHGESVFGRKRRALPFLRIVWYTVIL